VIGDPLRFRVTRDNDRDVLGGLRKAETRHSEADRQTRKRPGEHTLRQELLGQDRVRSIIAAEKH
jgi:hypothetical protein